MANSGATDEGPEFSASADEPPASSTDRAATRSLPPPPPSRPTLAPGDPARDLAGALHEVSNALTVVLGWIERARGADEPADVHRALGVAATRAAHARSIVRRAIGAEAGAEPQAVVGAVVADALVGIEPELRRAGLTAAGLCDREVEGRAIAHPSSVLQILTNLLLNAAAMAPRGSVVRVEVTSAPGHVVIAVCDAGPGIPRARWDTLFEAGVTTRAGGAGIGLRHAAAMARALGGRLGLGESEAGARFELSWPLAYGEAEEHVDAEVTYPSTPLAMRRAMPLEGTRILLVEDDEAVVDLLDTALTARGADVVSIRHRRELSAALRTGRFDAALFDLSPIQDDAHGAVASAREASTSLRVVMISGSAVALPAMPEDWISAWVRKPFEIGEILQAIAPEAARR